MRLKPKSTVHNPRALLYKRFTDLETALAKDRSILYYSEDGKYWEFSSEMLRFIEWTGSTEGRNPIPIGGTTSFSVLFYRGGYFVYRIVNGIGAWEITTRKQDYTESFKLLNFSSDENGFVDSTVSLNEYFLPQTFPSQFILTSNSNITGLQMDITDDFGHTTHYTNTQNNVFTKSNEFDANYEKSTIHIWGQASTRFNITVNVTNGSIQFIDSEIIGEGEYVDVRLQGNSGYYAQFAPTIIGAEFRSAFYNRGYEPYYEGCAFTIGGATADVEVYVDFKAANEVVRTFVLGQAVPNDLVAKYLNYGQWYVNVDFNRNGYIDPDPNLEYTIEVSEYNGNSSYTYTGKYKGQIYTNSPLNITERNGKWILKSPADENYWHFSSEDAPANNIISGSYERVV